MKLVEDSQFIRVSQYRFQHIPKSVFYYNCPCNQQSKIGLFVHRREQVFDPVARHCYLHLAGVPKNQGTPMVQTPHRSLFRRLEQTHSPVLPLSAILATLYWSLEVEIDLFNPPTTFGQGDDLHQFPSLLPKSVKPPTIVVVQVRHESAFSFDLLNQVIPLHRSCLLG